MQQLQKEHAKFMINLAKLSKYVDWLMVEGDDVLIKHYKWVVGLSKIETAYQKEKFESLASDLLELIINSCKNNVWDLHMKQIWLRSINKWEYYCLIVPNDISFQNNGIARSSDHHLIYSTTEAFLILNREVEKHVLQ